jgi:glucoamylase
MESPFVLHMGFDGWKAVEDRSSAALPFGRHGVRLGKDELAGNRVLDFTRYFSRDSKWEGNDYHIWIAPQQERLDVRGRPPAQH